ncbi:tRNA (adenine(37)-N6)-methyltransferase (tRNA methyltransferase O) [Durusdinium trenchii]|uniref:tRNA (Adenine(37)-N6)-methyltransferase (tRNA methyltransferase O) n=1 Tax=Durusdinium trenchii TaxID=1381693 RepID=A0ABP0LC23_9DINO
MKLDGWFAAPQLREAEDSCSTGLNGMSMWVCALSLLLAASCVCWFKSRRQRLTDEELWQAQQEANRQSKLRDEERKGRIRAEQELRQRGGAASAPEGLTEGAEPTEAFTFHPIGTFQSCYQQRCGTPRQSNLVKSSLATLRCVRDLNPEAALEGLVDFSHVWVLYIFHENTNTLRGPKSVSRRRQQQGRVPLWQGLCMKVAPPRCPELRVGVLACRTPHRPNPIGLSLAKVVEVKPSEGILVLAGLDVIDGTPCLDLKPYLPSFEAIDASVPQWVQTSYEEPMMEVTWSPEASQQLSELQSTEQLRLEPFHSAEQLKQVPQGIWSAWRQLKRPWRWISDRRCKSSAIHIQGDRGPVSFSSDPSSPGTCGSKSFTSSTPCCPEEPTRALADSSFVLGEDAENCIEHFLASIDQEEKQLANPVQVTFLSIPGFEGVLCVRLHRKESEYAQIAAPLLDMVLREISAPNRKDIFREDKNLEVGEECPILSDLHGRGLFRAEYISARGSVAQVQAVGLASNLQARSRALYLALSITIILRLLSPRQVHAVYESFTRLQGLVALTQKALCAAPPSPSSEEIESFQAEVGALCHPPGAMEREWLVPSDRSP